MEPTRFILGSIFAAFSSAVYVPRGRSPGSFPEQRLVIEHRFIRLSDVTQNKRERDLEEEEKEYFMFEAGSFRNVSHRTSRKSSRVIVCDPASDTVCGPILREYWTASGAI